MFTPPLTLRRNRRTLNPATTTSLRLEVCPPSLRHGPDSVWQRVMAWLLAPAPVDLSPVTNRLQRTRADFHASVADITIVPDAGELVRRIDDARSLREFWHLRTEVYRLVALQHNQAEAEIRLLALSSHFPTRTPRSSFAPL